MAHQRQPDREGKPITRELFAKSKANYVAKNQPADIVGFYSENHPGVFISAYAPAITADSGVKNAIHIHMVSRDGNAAGHIDDITLAPGMTSAPAANRYLAAYLDLARKGDACPELEQAKTRLARN